MIRLVFSFVIAFHSLFGMGNMKIKFFVLLLCFASPISNGFVEPGFPGDDESERLFQESLIYLRVSLGGLSYLANRDYVPALQLLGFLSQDLKEAEKFVREYNEKNMTPKWPVPDPSQGFWDTLFGRHSLKQSWHTLSLSRKELNNLQWSGMFHESLVDLTKSFDLLNQAMENSSVPKQLEFQNHFEQHRVKVNKALRTPIHPRPERLTKECEKIFADSFIPAVKSPKKSSDDTK